VVASDGEHSVDEPLLLEPGASVSGRIVFDGRANRPKEPEIRLMPLNKLSPQVAALPWSGILTYDADGRFTIDGVLPGRYALSVADQLSFDDPRWLATGITSNRDDVFDLPIDLGPAAAISDVVVTMSDRMTGVSGRLTNGVGQPVTDATVVVFSADDRYWWSGSPRVRLAALDDTGAYSAIGLAPGDYLVSVLAHLDNPRQLPDLHSLVQFGMPISIVLGERKVLDLKQTAGK
jgi:hypothetical protein